MNTIHAVFENGVFRPTRSVELPEHCEVEFEPRLVDPSSKQQTLDEVYDVLSERYSSGESDVAARHDEHQPCLHDGLTWRMLFGWRSCSFA